MTRQKQIEAVVEILRQAGQITSKYESKSHLIAGDNTIISHEQYGDVATAIVEAIGLDCRTTNDKA